MKECDWKDYGGKHHESKITSFWQGYVMYEKFGKDYRRPTFSAQICGGQISREDALTQLAIVPFNLEKIQEEKIYISKKFGISLEDLEQLLNLHPKCYKDFPNNKDLIDFCYKLYEKYFNSKRV